jgi:hypothetical protein
MSLPQTSVAQAIAPRSNQKTAADGVFMSGEFTYLFSGGTVTVSLDQISNVSGAAGPMRLSLWASTTQEPVREGQIPGLRLVSFDPVDPVDVPGTSAVITRTAAYTAPPYGTYWIVLSLERFDPASCPDVADGFCPEDNMASFQQESWAPTSVGVPSATLENPGPGSFQSGIGLISGWACAGPVGVAIDGVQFNVLSGTTRADTAIACGGGTNNGFGLLINYNNLGPGAHTAQLFVNGTPDGDPVTFNVTVPQGEFMTGLARTVSVPDFPSSGRTTTLVWQESLQNFAIQSVAP